MKVRHLLPVLLFGLLPLRLWATAQAPEILRIDGKTYRLQSLPLKPYLDAHPKSLPEPEIVSSGNWRGYIGTWSIRDGKLFLEDVRVDTKSFMDPKAREDERTRSVMKPLFGAPEPRQAAWFTGRLIVPTGELVEYVHMGFASEYSSYLVATIVKGEVRDRRNMTHQEFEDFRRRQFQLFKKTPEYEAAVKELRGNDPKMPLEKIEDFIYKFESGAFETRIFEAAGAP